MQRYRLTFNAYAIGMLERRRVSAIRSGATREAAIATLSADYTSITNLLVEVL